MKPYFWLALVVFVGAAVANVVYSTSLQPVHYHAGFRVYVDGALQDYGEFKYMNITPCSEHVERKSAEVEQREKAHLHDGVGDVVHIHREGAVWGDLVQNVPLIWPSGKPVGGYIDGERVEDIISSPIRAYTTALLIVGDDRGIDLQQTVPIEHIKEVEAKSELCWTS